MKARSIILAAAGALAVMAAISTAQAGDDRRDKHGRGYGGGYRGHYDDGYERPRWGPQAPRHHWQPYGYYAPPPVYYAPPAYYAPPRHYGYAPPPALYFGFELR